MPHDGRTVDHIQEGRAYIFEIDFTFLCTASLNYCNGQEGIEHSETDFISSLDRFEANVS